MSIATSGAPATTRPGIASGAAAVREITPAAVCVFAGGLPETWAAGAVLSGLRNNKGANEAVTAVLGIPVVIGFDAAVARLRSNTGADACAKLAWRNAVSGA